VAAAEEDVTMALKDSGIASGSNGGPLFEVAVNNFQELFAGLNIGGRAGKMGPDMILQYLAQ